MPSRFEQVSDREVVFHRVLDAPRELVWEVFTHPRHLHEWWGPHGYRTTTQGFVFEPDGEWTFVMHGPDGSDMANRVVFREIDPPSRLAFDNWWYLPDAPLDFRGVITLEPEGRRTHLAWRFRFRDAAALRVAVERYGVEEGARQTVDRMANHLRSL